MTLSITTLCHYAEGHILFTVMLNVVMLSVIILNVVAPMLDYNKYYTVVLVTHLFYWLNGWVKMGYILELDGLG
jgi:hypothetical protein